MKCGLSLIAFFTSGESEVARLAICPKTQSSMGTQ